MASLAAAMVVVDAASAEEAAIVVGAALAAAAIRAAASVVLDALAAALAGAVVVASTMEAEIVKSFTGGGLGPFSAGEGFDDFCFHCGGHCGAFLSARGNTRNPDRLAILRGFV